MAWHRGPPSEARLCDRERTRNLRGRSPKGAQISQSTQCWERESLSRFHEKSDVCIWKLIYCSILLKPFLTYQRKTISLPGATTRSSLSKHHTRAESPQRRHSNHPLNHLHWGCHLSADSKALFPSASKRKAHRVPPFWVRSQGCGFCYIQLSFRDHGSDKKRSIQVMTAHTSWSIRTTVEKTVGWVSGDWSSWPWFLPIHTHNLFKVPNQSQKVFDSNSDPGARTPWFKFWPCYLPVARPGERCSLFRPSL